MNYRTDKVIAVSIRTSFGHAVAGNIGASSGSSALGPLIWEIRPFDMAKIVLLRIIDKKDIFNAVVVVVVVSFLFIVVRPATRHAHHVFETACA